MYRVNEMVDDYDDDADRRRAREPRPARNHELSSRERNDRVITHATLSIILSSCLGPGANVYAKRAALTPFEGLVRTAIGPGGFYIVPPHPQHGQNTRPKDEAGSREDKQGRHKPCVMAHEPFQHIHAHRSCVCGYVYQDAEEENQTGSAEEEENQAGSGGVFLVNGFTFFLVARARRNIQRSLLGVAVGGIPPPTVPTHCDLVARSRLVSLVA